MSEFSRFLSRLLSERGSQSKLARAIGTNPGTVNKWLSGEHVPNFESCLRLADYFKIEPRLILQLTGNLEYYRLYLRLFRRAELETDLHSRLQSLIDLGYSGKVERALNHLETDAQTERETNRERLGSSYRSRT